MLSVITLNTLNTLLMRSPALSLSSMVFAKVGGAGLLAIAAASRFNSSMANWIASSNCSGFTWSHGGTPS